MCWFYFPTKHGLSNSRKLVQPRKKASVQRNKQQNVSKLPGLLRNQVLQATSLKRPDRNVSCTIFHPYKTRVVQELAECHLISHKFCRKFKTLVKAYEVHSLFMGKDGNFHLSRFVTKQIFRHWINETPTD